MGAVITNGPIQRTAVSGRSRPKSLADRAIESALNQTSTDLRVCVYDNASGDATANVVRKLCETDSRVTYLCHPTNVGALANFQYALAGVKAKYFSFLSDDDYLLPSFYERLVQQLESRCTVAFYAANVLHKGQRNRLLKRSLNSWQSGIFNPPSGLEAIADRGHSEWTGIVFKTKGVLLDGSLREDLGVYTDVEFTLRRAAIADYIVDTETGAVFVTDGAGRKPYSFDWYWPTVERFSASIESWTGVPPSTRARITRRYQEQFVQNCPRLCVQYLVADMPGDAEAAIRYLTSNGKYKFRVNAMEYLLWVHLRSDLFRQLFKLLVLTWRHTFRLRPKSWRKHGISTVASDRMATLQANH
jgi:glycosyltransferase involved in cell wall biosynthesis